MKKILKNSVTMMAFTMVTGCSFMSPVKVGPDTGYVINSAADHVAKSSRHQRTMLIMHPETNPAYNTTRMAFTMHPYQLSYYSQSRWIEAPADMFAPLIMQSIQKSGRFKSVIAPPFAGQYQYALRTQIKTLHVDYARQMPTLDLQVQAAIIAAGSGNIVATRDFKVSVPLQQYSPYGATVAANRASSIFLSELTAWTLHHTP